MNLNEFKSYIDEQIVELNQYCKDNEYNSPFYNGRLSALEELKEVLETVREPKTYLDIDDEIKAKYGRIRGDYD